MEKERIAHSWSGAEFDEPSEGPHVKDGSASPTNLPLQVGPPKPARVVAASSPQVFSKRKLDDVSDLPLSSRTRICTNSPEEKEESQVKMHFDDLLEECKVVIMSYLILDASFLKGPWAVSRSWHSLCKSPMLWKTVPSFAFNGTINHNAFRMLGLKNKGTEGNCYKVLHRRSGKFFAMKKARVYPTGEGVPYYMIRELAFLQGLRHPHIAAVEKISLVENNLYLFFSYMEKSLFDLINPNNDANGGLPLPPALVKRFLYQILQGVAFCHQRGVLHRNLKPKHLLVDIPALVDSPHRCIDVASERSNLPKLLDMDSSHASPEAGLEQRQAEAKARKDGESDGDAVVNPAVYERLLKAAEEGTIRISDFALVRSTSIPLRNYTTEVVTLWYRSPEVLMGGQYFAAVDVWSVGCVFAEMILGKPLFPGICEIDQLFQIFLKLGTPDESTWESFKTLPNYGFEFPNWKRRSLKTHLPTLDAQGLDLLSKMLQINPDRRITAEEALTHPFFDEIRQGSADDESEDEVTCTNEQELKQKQKRRQGEEDDAAKEKKAVPKIGAIVQRTEEDPDFPALANPSGSLDLNTVSWTSENQDDVSTSCWEYSRSLQASLQGRYRSRQGLDDPVYLVRYYHYLKCLESEMYPLLDYLTPQDGSSSSSSSSSISSLSSSSWASMALSTSPVSPLRLSSSAASQSKEGGGKQFQSELQPVHRSMLVDWLVEVIDVFDMSVRSVFMAVNYTDRYLALQPVEKKRFQLLGATCLHIASKCEDVSYIGVEDLVVCADKVYRPEDVLQLEEHVLNTLDFRICVPTVIDFLNVFIVRFSYNQDEDALCTVFPRDSQDTSLPLMDVPQDAQFLARYFSELSLQEHFFITKLPSMVAAAALVLACFIYEVDICGERVQAVTGYTLPQLSGCIEHLRIAMMDAPLRANLHVIHRRYQRPAMRSVANVIMPSKLANKLETVLQ